MDFDFKVSFGRIPKGDLILMTKRTKDETDRILAGLGSSVEKIKWLATEYPDNYSRMVLSRKDLCDNLLAGTKMLECKKTSTRVYWFVNGIKSWDDPRVRCANCGKSFKGMEASVAFGYNREFCVECAKGNPISKARSEATCMKKYGTAHPAQSGVVKSKVRETCFRKYGAASYSASVEGIEKIAAVKTERYGDPHYVNVEKRDKTIFEKYGVKNAFQAEECKEKILKTRLERYGSETFTNPEKAVATKYAKNGGKYLSKKSAQAKKDTSIARYGVDNPAKSNKIKAKAVETNRERYGCDYVSQNEKIRAKQSVKYTYLGMNFDSAPELAYYIWLIDSKTEFVRSPKPGIKYEFGGQWHTYYPDFEVVENGIHTLVEIKGDQFFREDGTMFCPFRKKEWSDEEYSKKCALYEAKHQCMLANDVRILKSTDYEKYLKYVDEKYGKGYVFGFANPKGVNNSCQE